MVPTPLTPPNEVPTMEIDHYEPFPNGLDHTAESRQDFTISTPISVGSIGHNDTVDVLGPSDDDLDMSESRVALSSLDEPNEPLTRSLSHAQQLNQELDEVDADIMGPDNMADMFDAHMSEAHDLPFYSTDYTLQPDLPSQHSYGPVIDGYIPEIPQIYSPAALPAMLNLNEHLQQLEHLQHIQTDDEQDPISTQHGLLIGNGTSPFPFSPLSVVGMGTVLGASLDFTHSTTSQHQATQVQGSQTAQDDSHIIVPLSMLENAGTGSIVPAPAQQTALEITPLFQTVSPHFISNGFELDDDSEADEEGEVDDQYNLGLSEFLYSWARSTFSVNKDHKRRPHAPQLSSIRNLITPGNIKPMVRSELQGDLCDIQRICWKELGVSRFEARQMRRQTYKNYTNLKAKSGALWHPRLNGAILSNDKDFFKFRRMDFNQDVLLSHFQLRNLLACASRDHIFYAGVSKVLHYSSMDNDFPVQPTIAMDFTEPTALPTNGYMGPFQISTLAVAHSILVTGGFNGEYGMVNLRAEYKSKHTEGILTADHNAITNHVEVHTSRHSSSPLATFASNDKGLRTIDVNTNKIVADYKYKHAINCSTMSPDQRLRVLVGDNRKVSICASENGQILQQLEGHRDFGFACDWADDGWTVATGNQDMKIMIWDARKWTTSSGTACPVATIAAEMAGVRKLKFSPVGSGKRVLVAAEPADFVSVIDAETFTSKQTLSFFGEIGGVDFTNDGQDIVVANCDTSRGGIMHYERCSLVEVGLRGVESKKRTRGYEGHDWTANEEDIERHSKSRSTAMQRARKPAHLGFNLMPF